MWRLIIFCPLLFNVSCKHSDNGENPSVLDSQSIIKWEVPKSYSESSNLPYKIPDSSYNIYYAELVGGMQEYHSFLRFNFDPSKKKELINLLHSQSELRTGKPARLDMQPLPNSFPMAPEELMPLKWWDLASILNGEYYSQLETLGLQIYIDNDKAVAYIYSSD
jgi:hypothetical protein